MRTFISILAVIASLAVALYALMDRQGSKPRRYVVTRSFDIDE